MTQNIDHRASLAPGEIRTHVVGNRAFQVMHVAGGSFTQASYRDGVNGTSVVIATKRFADNAVRAYADAIEQAESGETSDSPSLAGDVAALRSMIEQQGKLGRQPSQTDMLATCDRIAAGLPQRATATGLDLPLWLHVTCGGTATGHTVPKLTVCRKCDVLTGEADWQSLYTLGGGQ